MSEALKKAVRGRLGNLVRPQGTEWEDVTQELRDADLWQDAQRIFIDYAHDYRGHHDAQKVLEQLTIVFDHDIAAAWFQVSAPGDMDDRMHALWIIASDA